jgi:hypothetical protein
MPPAGEAYERDAGYRQPDGYQVPEAHGPWRGADGHAPASGYQRDAGYRPAGDYRAEPGYPPEAGYGPAFHYDPQPGYRGEDYPSPEGYRRGYQHSGEAGPANGYPAGVRQFADNGFRPDEYDSYGQVAGNGRRGNRYSGPGYEGDARYRPPDGYGYASPGDYPADGYRSAGGYEQPRGFQQQPGWPPGGPSQPWPGPAYQDGYQPGGRPPPGGASADYGYASRPWQRGGYEPGQRPWDDPQGARDGEQQGGAVAGRETAVQPVRPKGPPAALPAGPADETSAGEARAEVGSVADEGGAAEPVAEAAAVAATADVASPTGTRPPPAAELPSVVPPLRPSRSLAQSEPEPRKPAQNESPGDSVGADDDTAPLPVIVVDSSGEAVAPAVAPVAPVIADPVDGGEDSGRACEPEAGRVRDPFEPFDRTPADRAAADRAGADRDVADRTAMPGMAQLAWEQRRSAARTSAGLDGPVPKAAVPSPARVAAPLPVRKPATSRPAAPSPAETPAETPAEILVETSGEPPGTAKLEQIKDLYITAEAIGEDALDQHFQQVSERQRELIREYFDQVVGRPTESQPLK